MQTKPLVTAVARYDLTHLSDSALLTGTRRLVGTSNQLFADLLAHLAEVEARGIHRSRACATLYTYCIYELRFSEDAAFRRVSAARLVKSFPILFDAVASGELHLTGLLMIGPHLTQANHLQVLARAKHRTKRELTRLIRQIDPLPDVPARIEPLGPAPETGLAPLRKPTWEQYFTSLNPVRELKPGERPRDWIDEGTLPAAPRETETAPHKIQPAPANESLLAWPIKGPQRYSVQFTATEEYADLVERAKALLSQTSEASAMFEVHLRAMRALVAQLEKRRYAARDSSQQAITGSREAEAAQPLEPAVSTEDVARQGKTDPARNELRRRGRHIPAAIRREVFRRDNAQCTYVDADGQRCRETYGLELHHRKPLAVLGEHSTENVTLHCRAHNALCAEQDFGRAYIERKRGQTRHDSDRQQRPR